MIRALVFDFDGTLVPLNELKRRAFAETVAAIPGAGARVEALVAANPFSDRHMVFAELCRQIPDCGDPEALAASYGAICEDRIVPLLIESELGSLFARLCAGATSLYLCSATPRDALRRIVERGGLGGYLAAVHGAPESKIDALHAIMREGGFRADEIAVIGDGENDRAAAQAAGCRFIAVLPDASQLHGRTAAAAYGFLEAQVSLPKHARR